MANARTRIIFQIFSLSFTVAACGHAPQLASEPTEPRCRTFADTHDQVGSLGSCTDALSGLNHDRQPGSSTLRSPAKRGEIANMLATAKVNIVNDINPKWRDAFGVDYIMSVVRNYEANQAGFERFQANHPEIIQHGTISTPTAELETFLKLKNASNHVYGIEASGE
jgi:hypothetical protein